MIQRAFQRGTVIPYGAESEEQKERRAFFQFCRNSGFGPHLFHSADYFSQKYGQKEDLKLLRYLILHLLIQDDSGHLCSCLASSVFYEECQEWAKPLETLTDELAKELPRLLEENGNLFSSSVDSFAPFIAPYGDTPDYYYLQRNFRDEKQLLFHLDQRLEPGNALDMDCSRKETQSLLGEILAASPYADNPELLYTAFETAVNNRLLVISGGPGTGKTTLLTYLLRSLLQLSLDRKQSLDIAVTAPTGRAAMRVLESLNRERERGEHPTDELLPDTCFTLHRLLGLYGGQTRSRDLPPLLYDVIIVDEASMVDIHLMGELFSRLLPSTLLVLVGDKDQLPSVDSGALLGDFLHGTGESGHLLNDKVLMLEKVFRSRSEILELARPVKEGSTIQTLKQLNSSRLSSLKEGLFPGPAVLYSPVPDIRKLPVLLSSLFEGLKELGSGFSCSIEDWEEQISAIESIFSLMGRSGILSPLRRGLWGAESLNRELDLIFSGKEGLPYHGRPVMVTSNLYGLNLYNGDRGVVFSFRGEYYLFFPDHTGGFRYFSYSKVASLQTSFVQTIHKSQGSEFEQVVLLLPEQGERILSREILYTGMTRAKERLLLFSNDETVERAVSRGVIRNSRVRLYCSGKTSL